ncbi:hypothetical protein COV81_00795 [Candidatus Peregrinibacteria bacterium CG11_big_fil_rev_8_21_14_0_20_41_10]|nr:MAG: hypothetical protein COV81_00795 [Candidatus Peregrinibacteria bacterium CG11_big_fil_rev_8_21_14_0_20_41_10]PIZ76802.1 MAG: hypothetical protein COY06_01380 [Candidatus Peregrinibacteria bacterium CG_4_10_14_0_2_um_filter_41_8]PJC38042.1 MAG: hypothetical protein CO045_02400 [Candidatus Peregrinibacteria bacterium CG_4_9_14_0_2_um_filter_41_14]
MNELVLGVWIGFFLYKEGDFGYDQVSEKYIFLFPFSEGEQSIRIFNLINNRIKIRKCTIFI